MITETEQWPEEEAKAVSDFALWLFNEEGRDAYHEWIKKEREHFVGVFNDSQLLMRFCVRFNELTTEKTKIYMWA